MTTLVKNPARTIRNLTSRMYNPSDWFFKNNFLDLFDDDYTSLTIPSINISERKDQYKIEMAAPGLKKEDFNIEVEGNMITISCEKESESSESKDKNGEKDRNGEKENGKRNNSYSRREYNYSRFSRSFTLPDYADTDRITAKYNDGILNLTIPKKPEAQKSKNQKITIQ